MSSLGSKALRGDDACVATARGAVQEPDDAAWKQGRDETSTIAIPAPTSNTGTTPLPSHGAGSREGNAWRLYFFFTLQGIGLLFPWNAFLGAKPLYDAGMQQVPWVSAVPLIILALFMLTNWVMVTFAVQYFRSMPVRRMIHLALGGNTASMLVFTFLNMSSQATLDGHLYFGIMAVSVVLSAVATGFQNSGLFGLVSDYPPYCTQAVMAGQALAGITTSTTLVFTLSVEAVPPVTYFVVAVVILLACWVTFTVFLRSDAYHRFSVLQTLSTPGATPYRDEGDLGRAPTAHVKAPAPLPPLLHRLKWHGSACFLTLFLTLLCFPLFANQTRPTAAYGGPDEAQRFTAIALLVFNVFDWLGRLLPRHRWLAQDRPKGMLGCAVGRLGFLGVFLLGNVYTRPHGADREVPLQGLPKRGAAYDVGLWVAVALLALSSGYMTTVLMMHAPAKALSHERARAGKLMTAFLVSGLACGISASIVLDELLRHLV